MLTETSARVEGSAALPRAKTGRKVALTRYRAKSYN